MIVAYPLPHINEILAEASCRSKLILKCFSSRDSVLSTRAFCTFVRPLLEFSSIIWSLYTVADINRLESVQRKFTKTIDCLRSSSYKERVINLGLDSLQYRRLKFGLVFCFKLLHGLVDVNTNDFVVLSHNNNLRGN